MRISQIKEQLIAVEEEVVIATFNGLLGSWESIHARNVCQKEVITFIKILGRAHIRRCSTHSKRKEDGKIKLSPSKEDPSSGEEYE